MGERRKRGVWLIDGHNAIFAIPSLGALQREGDRTGARQRLEALLESFALKLDRPLLVVYDGNALPANPDAVARRHLRTVFSQPPEEADDRIVFLAQQALERGQSVTVVTNDRRTLAARLPQRARVMSVDEFRDRHLLRRSPTDEETPPGDFTDLEQRFLERQEEIQEKARRTGRRLQSEAARRWTARHGGAARVDPATGLAGGAFASGGGIQKRAAERHREPHRALAPNGEGHRAEEPSREQRLAEKRERGRRKQDRRLERLRRAGASARSKRRRSRKR